MPRPISNGLHLDDAEYVWLLDTIRRYKQVAEKAECKTTRERTIKANIIDLAARLDGMPEFDHIVKKYVVYTKRVDLRIIQKWARNQLDALVATVIPGYQDRINNTKDVAEIEQLKTYLKRASDKANTAQEILNKVARRLR